MEPNITSAAVEQVAHTPEYGAHQGPQIQGIHIGDPLGYGFEGRIAVNRETSSRRMGFSITAQQYAAHGLAPPASMQRDFFLIYGFYSAEELQTCDYWQVLESEEDDKAQEQSVVYEKIVANEQERSDLQEELRALRQSEYLKKEEKLKWESRQRMIKFWQIRRKEMLQSLEAPESHRDDVSDTDSPPRTPQPREARTESRQATEPESRSGTPHSMMPPLRQSTQADDDYNDAFQTQLQRAMEENRSQHPPTAEGSELTDQGNEEAERDDVENTSAAENAASSTSLAGIPAAADAVHQIAERSLENNINDHEIPVPVSLLSLAIELLHSMGSPGSRRRRSSEDDIRHSNDFVPMRWSRWREARRVSGQLRQIAERNRDADTTDTTRHSGPPSRTLRETPSIAELRRQRARDYGLD